MDFIEQLQQLANKTYIGQNAFGVKRRIKYTKFENVLIKINKSRPDFTLANITPENAQIMLPNLRLLIVGTLLQPFAETSSVSYKPTIDDPEHIDGRNYSLIMETEEIWLYDFETGKILAKEKF